MASAMKKWSERVLFIGYVNLQNQVDGMATIGAVAAVIL